MLRFFPNGSFVQALGAADAPALVAPEAGPGTGRYHGLVRNLEFNDPDGRNVDVTALV